MNTPSTTFEPEQEPVATRRNRLWLWRGLVLAGLLFALWIYVLPYQTGVRLDQSLNGWVSDHPDWTLKRLERGLYQRHYQLRWQPDWASEPVVLDVRVFPEPFGWSSPAGRQLGWATFIVHMDTASPVQIRNWPDRPIAITGQVETLGLVRFNWSGSEADSSQLIYDRSGHTWQGTLNIPGWQVLTPAHHYLFGRTLIDLHLHRRPDPSEAYWRGLDGELGVDIRRIGWGAIPHAPDDPTETPGPRSSFLGSTTSGLIDHFQWRIRLMPDFSGGQRDVIGSGALDALQMNGQPLGGGQLAFAVYAADPDFAGRFVTLCRHMLFAADATTTRQALIPVLSALHSSEIRLDALRWQTPSGAMDISGKAYGPRFSGVDPLRSFRDQEAQDHWQAQAKLQFTGAIAKAPPIAPLVDWLDSWLPAPIPRHTTLKSAPVRLDLIYSPDGWELDQTASQNPSSNHTKTP